tara:strand:- start:35 stop:742 length:708 start_codon:yes stop_codon:yes gene_type:complete
MSDDKQVNQPKNDAVVEQVKETKTDEVKPAPQFTQEQLDNIIKQRLQAEQSKYTRQLEEQKKAEEEAQKDRAIKEAKTKADLEKLMQEKIASKDAELQKMRADIKKEKIDNSLLSVASRYNAINPQQVSDLIKNQVRLSDDNRIEILDNNSNIRYNPKGELFSIEDRVKEFLEANPHFSASGKSGSGSQSSVGGKTVKPFNIQDLDLSKPEDRKKYAEYRKQRDSGPVQINLNNK